MKSFSIFLSSPSDVRFEREEARRVIERLARQFGGRAHIGAYFWESEPLEAAKAPQDSIREAQTCDIVVGVLWSRMGTPLGARYARADGTPYESGTAYELETALAAGRAQGTPHVLLYRNSRPVTVPAEPLEARQEAMAQYDRLTAFLAREVRGSDGSWRGAYKEYGDVEQFKQMLDEDLMHLIEAALDQSDAPPPVPAWTESPYRGLAVFDLRHEAIFFGRTKAIGTILEQLNRQLGKGQPFVLVLGMSGSGKSSLLRAGVLPRLFRARAVGDIEVWRHAIFKPREGGGDPVAALAQALRGETALPSLADEVTAAGLRDHLDETIGALRQSLLQAGEQERVSQAKTIGEYIERLERDRRGAEADEVRAKLSDLRTPKAGLVLVIDQMEELFDEQVTSEQRSAFMTAVDRLVRRGVAHVLGTLRSDFYARCPELPALEQLKAGDGQFDLTWPGPVEIGEMIRQPARLAALQFEVHPQTGQPLDERLRDDAVRFPENLPLLEFVLDELYERRTAADRLLTHAAYEELGELEGAIAKRATDVWNTLPAAAQKTAGDLFAALVQISGPAATRPQRKYAPAAALTGDPHRKAFVDAFVAARLFVASGDDDESSISLAHETLIEHFPPLSDWVAKHREQLRSRGRLAAAALLWEEKRREADNLLQGRQLDEAVGLQRDGWLDLTASEQAFITASKRARSRWRAIVAGVTVGVLGMLAVSGVLFWLNREARGVADAQRLVRDADAVLARDPRQSVSLALEATAERPGVGAPALRRALEADREVRRVDHPDGVRAIAFGHHKPVLAIGTWKGAFVADASLSKDGAPLDAADDVESVAISPDDAMVLTAGAKGVRLWRDGTEILPLPADALPITDAAFAPTGNAVAYIDNRRYRLWTSDGRWTRDSMAERSEELAVARAALPTNGRPVVTAANEAFSPDGAFVATGYEDGTTRITRNDGTHEVMAILERHDGPVFRVQYSPGGRFVATASEDGTIVSEASTGERVARLRGHTSAVHGLAFDADGTLLATGADDGVRLWALHGSTHPMRHGDSVNAAVFNRDGHFLLTASTDGAVRIWRDPSGELIGELEPPDRPALKDVAVDGHDRWIAAAEEGSTVDIWDAATCALVERLDTGGGNLSCVSFAGDGTLMTGGADGILRRWSAGEWKEDAQRLELGEPITAAAASPGDAAVIAAAGRNGSVRVWDVRSPATPRQLVGAQGRVYDIAFSDDGQLVVAAAADGGVHIWEVQTGRERPTLWPIDGSRMAMRTARFRPGPSRQVVTADEDGRVRVWDAPSATEITSLPSHAGPVTRAAFRPDGLALVTASADGTARVHLWSAFVPAEELLERAKQPRAVPEPYRAAAFACSKRAAGGSHRASVDDAGTSGDRSARPTRQD